MYIAENIKLLRKRNKMSQEELGSSIGKTKGAVSSYEKSATYPSVEALVAIARLFELSVDDLLLTDLRNEMPSKPKANTSQKSLSEKDKLALMLEMQKNEITLLKAQLEDLHQDKKLHQDQIQKLWDLVESYRSKLEG